MPRASPALGKGEGRDGGRTPLSTRAAAVLRRQDAGRSGVWAAEWEGTQGVGQRRHLQ